MWAAHVCPSAFAFAQQSIQLIYFSTEQDAKCSLSSFSILITLLCIQTLFKVIMIFFIFLNVLNCCRLGLKLFPPLCWLSSFSLLAKALWWVWITVAGVSVSHPVTDIWLPMWHRRRGGEISIIETLMSHSARPSDEWRLSFPPQIAGSPGS